MTEGTENTLYIVMPAYNEEANIRDVVRTWYPLLSHAAEDSRLVIADSGSTDTTHEILCSLQRECSKLEILSGTLKQHGPKLLALYSYAVKNGAQYVFQTDSDGQTDPADFLRFWKKRGRYDVILGNRVERGDGRFRKLSEDVVCAMLRVYFHVKVPDANAPFRLMSAEVLKNYLPLFPDDYSLPNIILTAMFARGREKMLFEPVTFRSRQGGANSVDVRKIIKIGRKSLGDFRRWKKVL